MQALKYIAVVEADGRLTLPPVPLQAGTSIEIIVLVPEPETDTNNLMDASGSSLDFWDNSVDDALYNAPSYAVAPEAFPASLKPV